MKRLALLIGLLASFSTQSAGALVAEVWTELSVEFVNLGSAEASATSTGLATLNTSSTASSHLSTITLPGQSLVTTVPVTDPFQAPITAVRFDLRNRPDLQGGGVLGNVSGAIGATAGGLAPNTIPMTGGILICLLGQHNCQFTHFSLPLGATSAGGWIGHGVGGILTIGGTGTLRISLLGAPYTVGTVTVAARTEGGGIDTATARGLAHGPLSLTSSTAGPGGVLQIVTANHITVVAPGDRDIGGSITRTLVHVIPEPGLFLLFGSGAALVAWLGWRRGR